MSEIVNSSLKQLMLESEESDGTLNYTANLGGETFKINVNVGSNTVKKGIKLEFTPMNEGGEMILNTTPEEMDKLQNSLITTLGPRFAKYKLELSRDTDSQNKQCAAMFHFLISFLL